MSVLACGGIIALLLVAGLAVDGTAQIAAQQRANDVAAQVGRWAMDAAAPYLVDGQDGRTVALTAARQAASRYPDLEFQVWLDLGGSLHIETRTVIKTTFLQLMGLQQLSACGKAVVEIDRLP